MAKKGAGYRLRKELLAINKDRPEFIWATHKETNILLWSFLVAPPDDTVYGSGWYWGRVTFPQDYPFAPPGIQFVTPSGRFRPETKICMSMSDYHPESWTVRKSNFKLCFNLRLVVVGARCCSLYAVEGISRRLCPSLSRKQGRHAEIARRDRSHSARSEERVASMAWRARRRSQTPSTRR